MPKNPAGPFWFIREGDKLIQCSKTAFDQAIAEGKSIKYNGYPNRRMEKTAEALEASRMLLLSKPDLPSKFRAVLLSPANVVQVEVINVDDPEFWIKESKNPKYQT
ncbi:MAG: hypothetical protein LBH74_07290 [Nitrososphaerota archaeon]|jgi:hypothetical protein|uniref:hypothetical protein n=1 Tax=Candidatus Bathycorpusculum sp. TaxID=2994959 RepID=UPI00281BF6B7|nr:hypothetical protein [Candidatus Termitimicrobium sp.]MCL2431926.1 hypothetical protein [Candidatus Termitimicrobium sp.]MDR0493422.1 hypothetical protein [Nitrososphaerota archaeon]